MYSGHFAKYISQWLMASREPRTLHCWYGCMFHSIPGSWLITALDISGSVDDVTFRMLPWLTLLNLHIKLTNIHTGRRRTCQTLCSAPSLPCLSLVKGNNQLVLDGEPVQVFSKQIVWISVLVGFSSGGGCQLRPKEYFV